MFLNDRFASNVNLNEGSDRQSFFCCNLKKKVIFKHYSKYFTVFWNNAEIFISLFFVTNFDIPGHFR